MILFDPNVAQVKATASAAGSDGRTVGHGVRTCGLEHRGERLLGGGSGLGAFLLLAG